MRDELGEAFNFLSASFHPSSLRAYSFISSLSLHPFFSSLIAPRSSLFFILFLVGAGFIIACAVAAAISRHQKSAGRPLHLEGRVGVVLEALEPEGAVLVDGELWRARSRGGDRLARGRVRIVGARGHWLEVEAVA